jgi:hypothetical protein
MIAMAGLLLQVIGWERTRDPQVAGHNQDPVDLLGGPWPVGLQVHAPRVSKPRTDQSHPPESMPADRLHGPGASDLAARPGAGSGFGSSTRPQTRRSGWPWAAIA